MTAARTALIVYAHPGRQSFSAALRDAAIETLEAEGYEVLVSDLYAQGFEAVAGPADVGDETDPDVFNLATRQGEAFEAGTLSPDILAEQAKVAAADLIIFQFPLWWFAPPAILKGWIDRVLSYKFAYGVGQWWDQGPFRDKTALLAVTTGTPGGAYAPDGRNGDIDRILWPMEAGVLAICGFKVSPPFLAYGVPWIGDEARAQVIDAYGAHLRSLETRPLRDFHRLDEFDEKLRLKAEVEPRTAGQHR